MSISERMAKDGVVDTRIIIQPRPSCHLKHEQNWRVLYQVKKDKKLHVLDMFSHPSWKTLSAD